jgi:hypothetical protein
VELQESGYEDENWIQLAHDWDQWHIPLKLSSLDEKPSHILKELLRVV